jgi:hypothetical protein
VDWTLDVRGWAIGARQRVIAIEGVLDGQALFSAALDVARPGVAAAQAAAADERIGFRAQLGTLRLPREFRIELSAVLAQGRRVPLGSLDGARAQLRTGFEPRRLPVLVTTLGRTGSMLLMRLLSFHPELLVYRPHRFEQRIASYWADVLLALAEPASYLRQIAPPPDVDDPLWWLGRATAAPWNLRDAPVEEWLGGEAVEALAATCQQRVEAAYDRIAATTDAGDGPLFAEKCNLRAAGLLSELYPGSKELFLVRDFRDMVSSIIAFNAKRGAQGFGRAGAATDAGYVDSLAGWATGLRRAWERRRDGAHLVRYEDLVTDPAGALGHILDYLGVDARQAPAMAGRLDEDLPELREHRTTAAPQASIGRWRQDLDPQLAAACEDAFGDALATFGYA